MYYCHADAFCIAFVQSDVITVKGICVFRLSCDSQSINKRLNSLVKELQNFWKMIKSQLLKVTWLLLFHDLYFPVTRTPAILSLFMVYVSHSGMCSDIARQLRCGHFLSHSFQFQLPGTHVCGFGRPRLKPTLQWRSLLLERTNSINKSLCLEANTLPSQEIPRVLWSSKN